METLLKVLRKVDDVPLQRELPDELAKELSEVTKGCKNVLAELDAKLSKFKSLGPSTLGFRDKARQAWMRLNWDQTEMDQFRTRINLNITGLNMFLSKITR